jgi:hypothetical protein
LIDISVSVMDVVNATLIIVAIVTPILVSLYTRRKDRQITNRTIVVKSIDDWAKQLLTDSIILAHVIGHDTRFELRYSLRLLYRHSQGVIFRNGDMTSEINRMLFVVLKRIERVYFALYWSRNLNRPFHKLCGHLINGNADQYIKQSEQCTMMLCDNCPNKITGRRYSCAQKLVRSVTNLRAWTQVWTED